VTVIATGFEEVGRPSRGKEFESIDDDVEELHAPFPLKKPMYSNNLFSKRQTVREEESEHQNESMTPVRSTFTTKPVSSVRSTPPSPPSTRPSSPPSQAEDSEEDLEIPAFIRKKMGM